MIGETAVVTDSASYLPAKVVEDFGISVVPITVIVDGETREEFVTIHSREFYDLLRKGSKVRTSQPPPGRFLNEYERLAAAGAKRIVSLHMGAALSGTVNSARIAAAMASIPVHVIDTGQASFIEGLCVWEACDVLAAGGSPEDAANAVERASGQSGNVFIVGGLTLLREGGRAMDKSVEAVSGVPVLAYVDGAIRPIGSAATILEAMDAMVSWLQAAMERAPEKRFRVGVGNGDADELAAELERRVRELPGASEVIPYTIGPAVGAHTGSGCTGLSFLGLPI